MIKIGWNEQLELIDELEIGSFVGGEIVGFITRLTKKFNAAGHAYKTEIREWH